MTGDFVTWRTKYGDVRTTLVRFYLFSELNVGRVCSYCNNSQHLFSTSVFFVVIVRINARIPCFPKQLQYFVRFGKLSRGRVFFLGHRLLLGPSLRVDSARIFPRSFRGFSVYMFILQ